MVCLPHPLVQVRLATQRFGRISNHPGKCFEGTEFCFVRNRPAIRCYAPWRMTACDIKVAVYFPPL